MQFSYLSFDIIIFALALGYGLGSIPFGMIMTRLGGVGDIRAVGSGNIGATNVLRTGHKGLAVLTLMGDCAKGTLAVIAASFWWGEAAGLLAGLAAFVGHLFPVWLQFKGGKGVATYIGVLIGVVPFFALLFVGIWLCVALLSRYSSLSALTASFVMPVALAFKGDWATVGLFTVLTMLVFLRHHENISRLMLGEESKIGGGKR